MQDLTPRQIVTELDRYIVGQDEAKRAVAVALRNRYRRRRLPEDLLDEVMPKNILMIGPTGVGKTEIARRLARLVQAPFVKVEVTKFTEVGYVGRDVDSMVRDLMEMTIRMVRAEKMEEVQEKAEELAQERLVELLVPAPRREASFRNPLEALFGGTGQGAAQQAEGQQEEERQTLRQKRQAVRQRLLSGELEAETVEVEVDDRVPPMLEVFSGQGMEEMGINLQDLMGNILPQKKKKRRVSVAEARKLLAQEEAQKLIDMDQVQAEAVKRAEQSGILFLDEMDKIAGREGGHGPDVSREGVQRDILPIVEGSTVMTKYGPVKTDHMLFIAAGAFHVSKPSDLIPELQGRFPIRVRLKSLGRSEFKRILVEPANALLRQYKALLATEGVEIDFTEDGIDEIANVAWQVNESSEDIGARRLHTILEKLLEDLLFDAPEEVGDQVRIDRKYVRQRLGEIVADENVSRYIL